MDSDSSDSEPDISKFNFKNKHQSSFFKYKDTGIGLDGYQISSEIGSGSFGKVYFAIDKKTGQSVAIKQIVHLDGDIEALIREISIMTQLSHPNIMGVIDVIPIYIKGGDKNDMGLEDLYIILEYVQTDLHNVITSENYLKDMQVKKIMYQIL